MAAAGGRAPEFPMTFMATGSPVHLSLTPTGAPVPAAGRPASPGADAAVGGVAVAGGPAARVRGARRPAGPIDADAQDVAGVVHQLTRIVDESKRSGSRIGYFACLYRQVTVEIAEGIKNGAFQDGPRMSRFDAAFGNRYLKALRAWRKEQQGRPQPDTELGKSWRLAFRAAEQGDPVIAQHLVLGVNAHINMDLAVAAALTQRGRPIAELKEDFDRINRILTGVLGVLQDALGELSPLFGGFDLALGRLDEELFGFSVVQARAAAWEAALLLDRQPDETWDVTERMLDRNAAVLARLVLNPPWPAQQALRVIRHTERAPVRRVIEHLDAATGR